MKLLKSAGLCGHAPRRFQFIKVANKGIAPIECELSVPFEVGGKTKIVEVLFVPQLSSDLILGLDFWRRYNLRPDFVTNTCEISVDSAEVFSASLEEGEEEDNVLTPTQRIELQSLLDEFRPILDTDKLGCLKGVEHHIDTGDAPPCKQKYSALNPKLLTEANKALDERLANGTVEPSVSPYSSPLLLLPKKDQGWRWVVDFRELNKSINRPNAHPLPHINPMLWNVRGGTIFSSIDVKDAYLQIALDKESRAKTAFAVQSEPHLYDSFSVRDGVLYKLIRVGADLPMKWVQVIPQDCREALLNLCHDVPTSAHVGAFRTFCKVRLRGYWPKTQKDVVDYVRRCKTCQEVKISHEAPAGFMNSKDRISEPFEVLSTDLIVHGAPRLLVSDNGQQYRGEEMKKLCTEFKIDQRFNLPYNPRSNPTERTNQTLGAMLRSYSKENQKKWDEHLPEIQHALRSSVSTVTGFSPNFLVFGKEVPLDGRLRLLHPQDELATEDPMEYSKIFQRLEILRTDVQKKLIAAQEKSAARYNLRRRPDPFKPGDIVKLKNFMKSDKAAGFTKKLAGRYRAPFTVVRKDGNVSYIVKDQHGEEIGPFHADQMQPYYM
ncbi:hypothetical protein FOCC_FOCC006187 [Frankliniella occidentalis]|nr:hypothetical protein FOCC_FOCC006187 [Frankliniella occidentalis]